jgi:hypothetical protein
MKIILSYQYSTLDKCHQFGLECTETSGYETYIRWTWFHLGEKMADLKINKKPYDILLFPFKRGKILKTYVFCNSAERQAKLIANRILKLKNK